jgi:hypothetical protein
MSPPASASRSPELRANVVVLANMPRKGEISARGSSAKSQGQWPSTNHRVEERAPIEVIGRPGARQPAPRLEP